MRVGNRATFVSRVNNKLWPDARIVLVGLPRILPFFSTQMVACKDME